MTILFLILMLSPLRPLRLDPKTSRPPQVVFGPDEWQQSSFILQIGHSFGNNLNVLLGFSDLIRQKPHGALGDPAYDEYAGHIQAAAKQLKQVLDDLIGLARIVEGEWQFKPSWLLASKIITDCQYLLAGDIHHYASMVVMIAEPDNGRLFQDENGLKMVIVYLLRAAMLVPDGGNIRLVLGDGRLILTMPSDALEAYWTQSFTQPGITSLIAALGAVLSVETRSHQETVVTIFWLA
jgi:signal transduction histidine kinase